MRQWRRHAADCVVRESCAVVNGFPHTGAAIESFLLASGRDSITIEDLPEGKFDLHLLT